MPQDANLILASSQTVQLSPFHKMTKTEVVVDPKDSHTIEGGLMLSKPQVEAIANAAGVRTIESRKLDGSVQEGVITWQAVVELTKPDGDKLQERGSYTLDVRYAEVHGADGARMQMAIQRKLKDTSPSNPMEERLAKARSLALSEIQTMNQFLTQRAESGAVLRAMRRVLSLKMKYNKQELERPFVVYSARVDATKMLAAGGTMAEQAQRMILGNLADTLGVDASKLLTAAVNTAIAAERVEDTNRTMLGGELEELEKFMAAEFGRKDRQAVDAFTMSLFGIPASDLMPIHDAIIREMAEHLHAAAASLKGEELDAFKHHLKDIVQLAVATQDTLANLMEQTWHERLYAAADPEPVIVDEDDEGVVIDGVVYEQAEMPL
jgi:hypothetical protein